MTYKTLLPCCKEPCYIPILVFSCLLYIRECQSCKRWSIRDKVKEWEDQDLLRRIYNEF